MKISRNKIILIVLIVLILIGTITYKILSNKEEEKESVKGKCDEKNFFIGSYYSNLEEAELKYFLLKSKKDYDEKKDIIRFSDIEKLDFEKHDYLVFLVPQQHGCNRTYQLKCFEQREEEIYLNFEETKVDDTCDTIFHDSIIIELEKDKYNDKTEIKTNI